MHLTKTEDRLYLFNFALLSTHEIDSAYWREWELFGIPGGIQGFLVINFVLLVIVLYGYSQLHSGMRSGRYFPLVLAFAGVFAFLIHGLFILLGHTEFTLPGSEILLVATFLVSVFQAVFSIKGLTQRPVSAT